DGIDIALQFMPISNLTISGTIGYNKAKFTKDAFSPGGEKIVTKDFVVPNSLAPWTYTASAQYDFNWYSQPLYFRADISYSTQERPEGDNDPKNRNYSRDLKPIKEYAIANIRIGAYLKKLDVSLFAKNITNEQPSLDADNSSAFFGYQRFAWTDRSITPRTYGISLSYIF